MEMTYTAEVSRHEADLIALALDSLLDNSKLNESEYETIMSLLLQFDYISDPDSFLQYAAISEFEEAQIEKIARARARVLEKQENLITVDFGKE